MAITAVAGPYPDAPPYDPGEAYPEYGERPRSASPNPVYAAVRETLRRLGYDRERYGTPEWNPLGTIVRPGDRVFLKPNLVAHASRTKGRESDDLFAVITHPAVVRALGDYVAIALKGRGELIVGDNPSIDADFSRILERTHLDRLPALYAERFGVFCRVLDLRPLRTDDLEYYGFKSRAVPQQGDPDGELVVDLGPRSRFFGLNPWRFRGAFSNRLETIRLHHGRTHRYSLSATVALSDVFISVPKLKAHHKVGVTLNLKGLVGTVANKNCLVHWQIGYPGWGGDEYSQTVTATDHLRLALEHLLLDALPESVYLALRGVIRRHRRAPSQKGKPGGTGGTGKPAHEKYRGAWPGNDTCWRMVADLYDALVVDVTGYRQRQGKGPMRFFSLVDGVTAGEGDGPFTPTSREARVLLAGEDLLAVDCVATRTMGFRLEQVRYLSRLAEERGLRPSTIRVISDEFPSSNRLDATERHLAFQPPTKWPELALPRPKDTGDEDHHSRGRQGRTPDAPHEEHPQAAPRPRPWSDPAGRTDR
ncbi:MAG: DUF362 domain-containing protein [Deltaproteobacteria bacterium]|nr:DUF362 domain-containing protein [Deltaproteobacteria bacterium]